MLICLWLKLPNQQNPTELNMEIFSVMTKRGITLQANPLAFLAILIH